MYGVESYGMSVTTLEEVFIKIAKGTESNNRAEEGRDKLKKTKSKTFDANTPMPDGSIADVDAAMEEGQSNRVAMSMHDFAKIDDQPLKLFSQHIRAMVMKRYLYFSRDVKTWIYQFLLPVLFVLAGVLILLLIKFGNHEPSLTLSTSLYNVGISVDDLPFPYADNTDVCIQTTWDYSPTCGTVNAGLQDRVMNDLTGTPSNYPILSLPNAVFIENVSNALLYDFHYRSSVFGAVTMVQNMTYGNKTDFRYIIHANFTAAYGAPLFNKLVAEGYIKTIDPSVTVTSRIYPLPYTGVEGIYGFQSFFMLLILYIF